VKFTESNTGAGNEAQAEITWTVTEPLIHPFFRNTDSKTALCRISSMDVEMSFGNVNAAYTIAPQLIKNYTDTTLNGNETENAAISGLTFGPKAYLVYRTFVPNTDIRPVMSLRYNRLDVFNQPVPLKFDGTSDKNTVGSTIAMSTMQKVFSHVPEKLFIFARPRLQFIANNKPEAFLRIDRMTIRTLTNTGCLSQASTAQLFQMSARNGLTMSYNKFARDIGSIVIIDLRKGDLGAHVPGTPGNFQIDVTVELTNTQYTTPIAVNSSIMAVNGTPAASDQDWDLYIIGTIPSKLVLDGTSAYSSTGQDVQEVLRALQAPPVHMMNDKESMLGGKSGWSKFVHGLGQVFGLARDALPVVGAVRSALGAGLGDDLSSRMSYGSGVQTGGSTRTGGSIRTGGSVLRTLK
jgi:hypothetical protein